METEDIGFMYSPPLLTEDGVLEVACNGKKFITKKNGILTIIDSISLAVIEEFSTYPEAKNVKFSPDSRYIAFIDKTHVITVIDIDSKEVYTVESDQNFLIVSIAWSINSEFLVFFSELDVFIGVYRIGNEKIILEGSVSDGFKRPLCIFNPDSDYFSIIRYDLMFSYCTETWKIHSIIKLPVNPIGFIYTDVYTVAVWTSSGKFVALSLFGENRFSRSEFSSRIKAVKLCQENRILAIATYDDKIELFDVLSWKILYSFEYPLELGNQNSVIWSELTVALQFSEKQFLIDNEFLRKESLCLSPIKNINDEFEMKTNLKFLLSFSCGNKLLASYCPGFHNIVWIRSLKTGKMEGILSVNDVASIQGFRWHPTKEILAILTDDSVIFWTKSKTLAIYCKYLLTSFHWINTKLTICGISTEKECMLVNLKKN